MAPHPESQSMSGPVFAAALRALEEDDVTIALPYVPEAAEGAVVAAFKAVAPLRSEPSHIRSVGNLHFAETVVRLHCTGYAMAYEGIRGGRDDPGGIVEAADEAIVTGSSYDLFEMLSAALTAELTSRLAEVRELAEFANNSIADQRRYVEASMSFSAWAKGVHEQIRDRT